MDLKEEDVCLSSPSFTATDGKRTFSLEEGARFPPSCAAGAPDGISSTQRKLQRAEETAFVSGGGDSKKRKGREHTNDEEKDKRRENDEGEKINKKKNQKRKKVENEGNMKKKKQKSEGKKMKKWIRRQKN